MAMLNERGGRLLRTAVAGLLAVLAFPSASCRKKVALETRPADLELARSSFAAGNCQGAADFMEEHFAREGMEAAAAEELLSLALCYLSGPQDLRDRDRALELLRHVEATAGEAESQRRASLLLELMAQARAVEGSLEQRSRRVRELEKEVEGLKRIDTRPGRPPL